MRVAPHPDRVRGFTLVELLCVIAIIALLAALVLPTLERGKAKAKQIRCASQLRQLGLGFHGFAHDHGSRFPMSVPLAAGGTRELAENSFRVAGAFYFSFRHFQALSNDLAGAQVLACPADTRTPVASFQALDNSHLSYLVGPNAEYGLPQSLLAADRNVASERGESATLLDANRDPRLRWTGEMHRYRGNLLFADGHVERGASLELRLPAAGTTGRPTALALPTVRFGGSSPGPGPTSTAPQHCSPLASASSTESNLLPYAEQRPATPGSGGTRLHTTRQPSLASTAGQIESTAPSNTLPQALRNGPAPVAPAGAPPGKAAEPVYSDYGRWVAAVAEEVVRHLRGLLWLVFLLIAAATLVFRRYSRSTRKGGGG